MRLNHCFFLSTLLLCGSCIKDEPKNMECDILEAWIGSEQASHFFQDTDMRLAEIPSVQDTLEFTVRSLKALPQLGVNFRLTPGATIQPANGSLQDFSQGAVTYTVTSEDGQWQRRYTVRCRQPETPDPEVSSQLYNFENYALNNGGNYYEWFEPLGDGSSQSIWATGNAGFIIAKPNSAADDYPTVPEANGYEGACVRLTTRNTGSWGKRFRKPIAAGNLFLGSFDSQYALTNTLWTTNMGIPYMAEPVRVTGYYRYQPGEVFTDKDGVEHTDRTDTPSIYAAFYRNHDAEGNAVVLHGDDLKTNPLIVRKAEVEQLPTTSEWRQFEMVFTGDEPIDPTLLANRGYSLALVFSSSLNGDTFEGSVGSTLYIDKVELYHKADPTK